MNAQEQVTRGFEASQVLDNPAYQSAMEALKAQIVDQWKACPVRDKEGQILLLQLAKLTEKFESILKGMVESGKFAQHKIDIDSARDEHVIRRWARKVA